MINIKDAMQVYAVNKDGSTTLLGEQSLTPKMKRLDLAQEFFGTIREYGDGSDPDLCLHTLELYHEWLVKEGFIKL